ncbi:MAG TPA: hypothetical protein PKC60_00645 [Hydrogenophaga sp.]|nr:hypothetical protein [Hydrogenophaga sp.]HMN91711.1 hypothetical protein [Hydrogenophaga sp.]HMP10571.1 hypothetical protein [Hydrogenophaga sp.]
MRGKSDINARMKPEARTRPVFASFRRELLVQWMEAIRADCA